MLTQKMAVCSVETRQSNYYRLTLLLLLALSIGIVGCGASESALKLKIERQINQADSLLIYEINFSNKVRSDQLKVKAIRGSEELKKIAEALSLANRHGTVIKSPADHVIVIAKADQILLTLEYCSKDGRLTEANANKPDVLFVPPEKRSVFN